MAKLPKLAAALTTQDTRLSEVLRLSLVEGLSIRAIARRLQLSRKTVRRLLGRAPERTPPSSAPRASLLDAYERPIGLVRTRFWRGRRFTDLMDLNAQAVQWRDDIANNRRHDETGKIPSLVFRHDEQRHLKPLPGTPFDVDDVETSTVTKTFRVTFDRNRYSVPWRLTSQTVLVRANDDAVAIFLGKKQVAAHRRSWKVGEDIEHPSHREGLLKLKPRAAVGALPPGLLGLDQTGVGNSGC